MTASTFFNFFSIFNILFIAIFLLFAEPSRGAPGMMLAGVYEGGADVSDYLVSEKLDGVRAYWDGKNLISRGGNIFASPDWFTEKFPSELMDGELWMGRNSFEQTVSIVRRETAHDGWEKITYMAFDLPAHQGEFHKRHKKLKEIVADSGSDYLKAVTQFSVRNHKELTRRLDRMTKSGGEGLMLHRRGALYKSGRSGDLLKLKKFRDAEAVVIAHNPGKGKFTGMLGSLTVETPEGVRFKIGTGFTDAQRKNPPAVGTVVTYKYGGLTNRGKPRFPSFWRIRAQ